MHDESGAIAERSGARRLWSIVRSPGLIALACVIEVVLAACAVVTPARPVATAVSIPQTWSMSASTSAPIAADSTMQLAAWWQRFNDPLLVNLIDDALQENTSVRSAIAALAQSRALVDVQSAALWPQLNAVASAQRTRSDHTYANTFNAGFDASWEPDIFGGLRSAVAAADADLQASHASLGDVQISIAAEVAVNYMVLRGLQTRVGIAVSNLDSQQETLQITQWRTQAGLLSSLEVEQARAAAEQTRAQIPLLQTVAIQSEHSLAVLTGRVPAALHEQLSSPLTVLTPADDLVLAFPTETLRQRPDVRAAESRVVAAVYRVQQAGAARYPNFQLSGSLGMSALTAGALTDGASVVGALLASVAAPLFDGGAISAQVRAQRAALAQAAAAYDAAILLALQDVEDTLIALSNDRERLQSLRAAAEAAHNAALLANQQYRSGLIDFQVVLETQRTALTTQDSVASTESDLNTDHVRLYKALGGGWNSSEQTGNTPDGDLPNRPNRSSIP